MNDAHVNSTFMFKSIEWFIMSASLHLKLINENQKSKIENCKNKVIGFEDKINFYFSLNLGQYLLSIPYLIWLIEPKP